MTSADWPASQGEVPDDVDSLKETIVSLTARLNEANEERAQAAEYGLVVLEEKQALQLQQEELNSLYESTKRELEASTLVGFLYSLTCVLCVCACVRACVCVCALCLCDVNLFMWFSVHT